MSLLSLRADQTRIRRLWSWLHVYRPEPNLVLYAPMLGLPGADQSRWVNGLNNRILAINLKLILKRVKLSPSILYLCYYTHADLIPRIAAPIAVYNAHDVWETYYTDTFLEQLHSSYEAATIAQVDLALFTSRKNLERKQHLNPCCHYLPQGAPSMEVDVQIPTSPPADMPQGPGLNLCYWGTIDSESVDVKLITRLAARQPSWRFVFIGPILRTDDSHFKSLERFRNVYFLGNKPREQRWHYFRHSDVGLLCARMTRKEMEGSQLKVPEYISGGLPVVSIPVEEYRGMTGLVYFADSPEKWETAIATAVSENSSDAKVKRCAFSAENSWNRRVAELSGLLESALEHRPPRGE